jgi:TorA maturation chaperone TorD
MTRARGALLNSAMWILEASAKKLISRNFALRLRAWVERFARRIVTVDALLYV